MLAKLGLHCSKQVQDPQAANLPDTEPKLTLHIVFESGTLCTCFDVRSQGKASRIRSAGLMGVLHGI